MAEISKKILFVLSNGKQTGATIYGQKIIKFLKSARNDLVVDVLCAQNGADNKFFRDAGIPLIDIGDKLALNVSFTIKILKRIEYYIRFSLLIFGLRPDLVYSNTITNNGEVFIAKLLGVTTLVHSHEGEVMARAVGLKLKVSSFFTDRYIAVSDYSAEVIRKILERTSTVIFNGIDLKDLNTPSSRNLDLKVIGVIGTVDKNKGQLIVVKALKILIKEYGLDLSLKIVGAINDGEYAKEIQRYCNENGLSDRVIFSGEISDIFSIYSSIDCLVNASYDEAMPLVMLEAMHFGVPLIASTARGNQEIIDGDITGQLFSVGSYSELAQKIHNLNTHPDWCLEMVIKARQCAIRKYNISDKLWLISAEIDKILELKIS